MSADHAALQRRLKTPICLDESIKTVGIAREAIAAGACRIINIKPGRVGGFAESIRLHDLCASHGIPVWHGGMLESGIGRAANIHLSTLPNFSLPGDVAASKRYFDPDLIDPPIEVAADGTIAVPTGPGLGVTIREDRVDRATLKQATFKAGRRKREGRKAEGRKAQAGRRKGGGRSPMMRLSIACVLAFAASACASAPPAAAGRSRPAPRFEQKMASILRLEDQRVLRDPAPPVAPPPPPPAPCADEDARRRPPPRRRRRPI